MNNNPFEIFDVECNSDIVIRENNIIIFAINNITDNPHYEFLGVRFFLGTEERYFFAVDIYTNQIIYLSSNMKKVPDNIMEEVNRILYSDRIIDLVKKKMKLMCSQCLDNNICKFNLLNNENF